MECASGLSSVGASDRLWMLDRVAGTQWDALLASSSDAPQMATDKGSRGSSPGDEADLRVGAL